jgi:hypothetical protein
MWGRTSAGKKEGRKRKLDALTYLITRTYVVSIEGQGRGFFFVCLVGGPLIAEAESSVADVRSGNITSCSHCQDPREFVCRVQKMLVDSSAKSWDEHRGPILF